MVRSLVTSITVLALSFFWALRVRKEMALLVSTVSQKKLNASVVTDITSERTTGWLVPTLFFFYRDIQVSGNVLK